MKIEASQCDLCGTIVNYMIAVNTVYGIETYACDRCREDVNEDDRLEL